MKLFARLGLIASILASTFTLSAEAQEADSKDRLVISLDKGDVTIQLRPDLAPRHVKQIRKLAADGFYDGIVFHRVIDGFMAQTGDPTGTGSGGSTLPDLPSEFSNETFDRGTVGMARTKDPNSANSQFFIMLGDGDFLDGQYTIIGDVVSGMEFVDQIKKGDASANGLVDGPDKMLKVRLGE